MHMDAAGSIMAHLWKDYSPMRPRIRRCQAFFEEGHCSYGL